MDAGKGWRGVWLGECAVLVQVTLSAVKCKACGKSFTPKVDAKYCSKYCYQKDYYFPKFIKKCSFCGIEFSGTKKAECCSRSCYLKRYLVKNKDKIKEKSNEYYHKRNPRIIHEKTCEICKKTFTASFGHSNQKYCSEKCRVKAYRLTDKGKMTRVFDYHKRRHDIKVNTYSRQEWLYCKEYFDNSCAYCGKKTKLHQDHFIPLALGGKYIATNIVPACPSCNFSKNKKHPKDFATESAYSKIMNYFIKIIKNAQAE